MDPWVSSAAAETQKPDSVDSGLPTAAFENNFVSNTSEKVIFERLPDSEEYLKKLESKLEKLTSTGRKYSEESKKFRQTLVEDLSKVREDTLANFVTNCDSEDGQSGAEIDLERSVSVNPVIRRLVPEQPITVGEQVVLTHADKLNIQSELEEEKEEGDNSQSEKDSESPNQDRQ